MNPFTPSIMAAAAEHARREFPREACGLVVGDAYWACENVAKDPLGSFEIADVIYARALASGELLGLVHSHPAVTGEEVRFAPSEADMVAQQAMCLPWAIIPLNDVACFEPTLFGDELGTAPVIGRPRFIHGHHDCMAVIRDAYRLGRAGLAAEGCAWPFRGTVELPNQPRGEGWWLEEDCDLYRTHFPKNGFRPIDESEVKPGDVFLCITPNIRGANPLNKVNHGGVYVGGNLILHHLPGRMSRREPIGSWRRAIVMWLRHEISDREAAEDEAAALAAKEATDA